MQKQEKENPWALTAVDLVRLIHAVVVAVAHPLYRDAAPVSTAVLLCGAAVWRKGSDPEEAGKPHDKHLELSGSRFQVKSVYSDCPSSFHHLPMTGRPGPPPTHTCGPQGTLTVTSP